MNARFACLAAVLWLSATTAALAHHSFAMFDMTQEVKLEGTVKTFKWTNPHAWAEINVPQSDGSVKMWAVELTSPNNLARLGWKRSTLKPGDKVVMTVHPLRDGSPGGSFFRVTLPDGTVMGQQ
jgi:hypothetical protein